MNFRSIRGILPTWKVLRLPHENESPIYVGLHSESESSQPLGILRRFLASVATAPMPAPRRDLLLGLRESRSSGRGELRPLAQGYDKICLRRFARKREYSCPVPPMALRPERRLRRLASTPTCHARSLQRRLRSHAVCFSSCIGTDIDHPSFKPVPSLAASFGQHAPWLLSHGPTNKL